MICNTEYVSEFSGYSGSKIWLVRSNQNYFVRKQGEVDRNYHKLQELHNLNYSVPKIYDYEQDTLDMQYIQGQDIKTYLLNNTEKQLIDWIINTIKSFQTSRHCADYIGAVRQQFARLSFEHSVLLPLGVNSLIRRFVDETDNAIPATLCHGDFTLDNLIWSSVDNKFYMIDAVTGLFDSWVFDLAKLRQDLDLGWFVRNDNTVDLKFKLKNIHTALKEEFPLAFSDSLYILMLIRVYSRTTVNTLEFNLIHTEITRLCE